MGGPEMAPQTPQPSERPGGAVTLLYVPFAPGGPETAPQTSQPSERPGGAVTLLYVPFAPGGPETAPQTPPAFGASRRSRDAEIGLDRIERSYYFLAMRKGEQTREAILVHALRLATKV